MRLHAHLIQGERPLKNNAVSPRTTPRRRVSKNNHHNSVTHATWSIRLVELHWLYVQLHFTAPRRMCWACPAFAYVLATLRSVPDYSKLLLPGQLWWNHQMSACHAVRVGRSEIASGQSPAISAFRPEKKYPYQPSRTIQNIQTRTQAQPVGQAIEGDMTVHSHIASRSCSDTRHP